MLEVVVSLMLLVTSVVKRDTSRPFVVAKRNQSYGQRKSKELPETKYMATTGDNSTTDEFQLYTIGAKSATCPITVDVQINGNQLPMEVDTGAALSIISERT